MKRLENLWDKHPNVFGGLFCLFLTSIWFSIVFVIHYFFPKTLDFIGYSMGVMVALIIFFQLFYESPNKKPKLGNDAQ